MLERRENANIRSRGVALVDVHNKAGTECNISSNTVSHCAQGFDLIGVLFYPLCVVCEES